MEGREGRNLRGIYICDMVSEQQIPLGLAWGGYPVGKSEAIGDLQNKRAVASRSTSDISRYNVNQSREDTRTPDSRLRGLIQNQHWAWPPGAFVVHLVRVEHQLAVLSGMVTWTAKRLKRYPISVSANQRVNMYDRLVSNVREQSDHRR